MKIQHERLNKALNKAAEKFNSFLIMLKNSFIAGVLFLVPSVVTIYTMILLFQFADGILGNMFAKLISVKIPGLGLILTILICIATGIMAKNYLGSKFLTLIDSYLDKIPVVRSLYSGIKQAADVIMQKNKSSFKRVVMLEYPKEDSWVIGFVTSDFTMKVANEKLNNTPMVTVFVPTTPNPTSGFLLILPKDKIVDMNTDIEEAMKIIISGGLVQNHTNSHLRPVSSQDYTEILTESA